MDIRFSNTICCNQHCSCFVLVFIHLSQLSTFLYRTMKTLVSCVYLSYFLNISHVCVSTTSRFLIFSCNIFEKSKSSSNRTLTCLMVQLYRPFFSSSLCFSVPFYLLYYPFPFYIFKSSSYFVMSFLNFSLLYSSTFLFSQ